MSQSIQYEFCSHDLETALDEGYSAMVTDTARETEAGEWVNALAKDMESMRYRQAIDFHQ